MSTIIAYRGLPGSGKTTDAKRKVNLFPETYVRVSRDDIRAALGISGGIGTPDEENMVTAMEDAGIKAGLAAGKTVLVDATNLNPRFVKRFFDMADVVTFRDFWEPLETLIERDAYRKSMGGRGVGEKVIRGLAKKYRIPETGELPPAPKPKPKPDLSPIPPWDDELPNAIIVDTDGTVADHRGVRNVYDTTKYAEDKVHGNVAAIISTLADSYFVIAVSGRDGQFGGVTEKWWIEHARIQPDEFYFRPVGDKRPDDVIKAEIYENHIRGRYNVVGVFDDRPRVLRMWHAKGLTTFRVGDPCGPEF